MGNLLWRLYPWLGGMGVLVFLFSSEFLLERKQKDFLLHVMRAESGPPNRLNSSKLELL